MIEQLDKDIKTAAINIQYMSNKLKKHMIMLMRDIEDIFKRAKSNFKS